MKIAAKSCVCGYNIDRIYGVHVSWPDSFHDNYDETFYELNNDKVLRCLREPESYNPLKPKYRYERPSNYSYGYLKCKVGDNLGSRCSRDSAWKVINSTETKSFNDSDIVIHVQEK
uniref:Uncharacterized protein n=1 Tax=Romanomermis culicivorax TaxID=13658 RepID=A0A915KDU3_ROMCU